VYTGYLTLKAEIFTNLDLKTSLLLGLLILKCSVILKLTQPINDVTIAATLVIPLKFYCGIVEESYCLLYRFRMLC